MSFVTAPRRRHFAILLVGCLAAALGGFAISGAATASSPTTPTSMRITSITSGYAAPADTPDGSAPTALVKAGETFTVRVEFFIGTTPASFSSNTNLKITSTAGTLSSTTGVALAGKTFALVSTSIKETLNRVGVTVTVANGPAKGLSTGPAVTATYDWRFDVLSDIQLKPATVGSAFTDGIGGDTACANATSTAPVCGIVVLPRGAGTSVLLSVGACDVDGSYAPCYVGSKKTGGAVVQALFAQPSAPYGVGDPLTIIVKCDKTLCGTGSIQNLTVTYSLGGDDPLVGADPCPAKGTMESAGVPCVDYVQSKRDGSGDTHLYLLTDRDIRTGIG